MEERKERDGTEEDRLSKRERDFRIHKEWFVKAEEHVVKIQDVLVMSCEGHGEQTGVDETNLVQTPVGTIMQFTRSLKGDKRHRIATGKVTIQCTVREVRDGTRR